MQPQKPFIGQIVHYYPSYAQNEHYVGIVVNNRNPLLSLRVFYADGSQGHLELVVHRSNTVEGECWDYVENYVSMEESLIILKGDGNQ